MGEEKNAKRVACLVVGAGIAGIQAALELAEIGHEVLMVDNSPYIGGILRKLDHQFPTDHCGMCRMLPVIGREHASQFCMRKSLFHDNIEIMPFTELVEVQGDAGAFQVRVLKKSVWIDTDICTGTGLCRDVCPVEVKDGFNMGLTTRKAVFRPAPHELPNTYVIDRDVCDKCGKCVEVCPVNAIDLEGKDEEITYEVGTIILASGSDLYQPANSCDPMSASYKASENVITSLEFERLISRTGTYKGKILRPSDGKEAKKIAWIQCCGSRNRKDKKDYCSSICCMFALKEAVLALDHGGEGTDCSIFYMDMRTFGKGHYRYREEAEKKGVKLIRNRPQSINPSSGENLAIRYFANEEVKEDIFDLVVLSTGQNVSKDMLRISEMLEVEKNLWGFAQTAPDYVSTSRDGVYACGSFTGLKEISAALISGSAAAANASQNLTTYNFLPKEEHPIALERDVRFEKPIISAILCKWPISEGPALLDFDKLIERLSNNRYVAEVHIVDSLCKQEGLAKAREILSKNKGNRVLFGACIPYIYKRRLKKIAEDVGLGTNLVEVVDLRGSVLVELREKGKHQDHTDSAWAILRGALEKLRFQAPSFNGRLSVVQRALIVGGGLAGMKAALTLAKNGIEVDIVEKSDQLGGHAGKNLKYTITGFDPASVVRELITAVHDDPRIGIHLDTTVKESGGRLGHYKSVIKTKDGAEKQIEHGVAIIAVGGREAKTDAYFYGKSDKVVTQEEIEEKLDNGKIDPQELSTVVMIQCVGSRERGQREYCSRVCCASALKNALKILEKNPNARIYVFYRDLMAYGFLEQYYSKARSKGVIFTSYELEHKPEVKVEEEKVIVRYEDSVLGQEISVETDILVLSTGISPSENNQALSKVFGVPIDEDGFFEEADPKWRPVDLMKGGFYVCGMANSPMPIDEALAQGEAVGQRAYSSIAKPEIITSKIVAQVKDALCSLCLRCIDACPVDARYLDQDSGKITVDEALCQGCGICATTCPNNAAYLPALSDKQLMALIDSSLR